MANITDTLIQLTELTRDNLNILEAINESFHTKKTNITTEVRGQKFTIPSFLQLENKVNHLQDAFDNLVHATVSGGANINYDGSTKKILLSGYEYSPSPLTVEWDKELKVSREELFKDYLSPQPSLVAHVGDLPDYITQVLVKKMVIYNPELLGKIDTISKDHTIDYGVVRGLIEAGDYTSQDYTEYDKIHDLPLRKSVGTGVYTIKKILDNRVNDSLDELFTIEVDQLSYHLQDGMEQHDLTTGCRLLTWDRSCKLEVVGVSTARKQLQLKVLHGTYCHLVPGDLDHGRLIFHSEPVSLQEDRDKTILVPLEEDPHVILWISPVNKDTRMHTGWGEGQIIDTTKLTIDGVKFQDYYTENVKNIGDIFDELTTAYGSTLSEHAGKELKKAPAIPQESVKVVRVNKHLDDSETAKTIRSLYAQKKHYEIDLQETLNKISILQADISSISFDDMSGQRSVYTAQLTDLKSHQNTLVTSIAKVMESISLAANNALVPIEAAKFAIRGYVPLEDYLRDLQMSHKTVRGIEVEYRYKNYDTPQANIEVIDGFLFTEWNRQVFLPRTARLDYTNGRNELVWDDWSGSQVIENNDIKFNQIDIPITQGEQVDIRVRVVWSFGYPWVKSVSSWSEIRTVQFPDELVKDVQLLDIVKENTRDLETNRFTNLLNSGGYTKHVEDAIQDQDLTYFHKPDSIASGFYTQERRIIPLRDKLMELDTGIKEMRDMIQGTFADSLKVTLVMDNMVYDIEPLSSNEVHLIPYTSVQVGKVASGATHRYTETGEARLVANIRIANDTNHVAFLYSMFPGPRDQYYDALPYGPFKPAPGKDPYNAPVGQVKDKESYKQKCNQLMMFRSTNPYDLRPLDDLDWAKKSKLIDDIKASESIWNLETNKMFVTPYLSEPSDILLESNLVNANKVLRPGEAVSIPVMILYKTSDQSGKDSVKYTIGFELRTSLYHDPTYYEITVNAWHNQSMANALSISKVSSSVTGRYNTVIK
jgi:hypothetical protein